MIMTGARRDTELGVINVAGIGNPLQATPLSKLTATRDHPLFSPSRRPPPPAEADRPAQPSSPSVNPSAPDAPSVTLMGTIIGGDRRIAIFVDQSLKSVTRIHPGEQIGRWTLRSVDPRSVVLELEGRTLVLGLPDTAVRPGGVMAGLAPRTSPRPALRAAAVARSLKRRHPLSDGL